LNVRYVILGDVGVAINSTNILAVNELLTLAGVRHTGEYVAPTLKLAAGDVPNVETSKNRKILRRFLILEEEELAFADLVAAGFLECQSHGSAGRSAGTARPDRAGPKRRRRSRRVDRLRG
jgi:hypothetical protein